MYPTLLKISGFRIDSYSVLWFIALSLAIFWVIKRLDIYKLDDDEARKIMSISFLFMLFGAHVPEYFLHWHEYFNKPSLFLDCNHGGLHETGAILGAFLSAFILSAMSKKISFLTLCEAAALPVLLAIAVGRWGCFLNGCCVGLPTKFFTAVHFPQDPAGVTRHPVQIYYSLFALISLLILLGVEKRLSKKISLSESHSIIAPLTLIAYGVMRLLVDYTRTSRPLSWRVANEWHYKMLAIVLPLEILWLAYGWLRLKKKSSAVKPTLKR